MQGCCGTRRDEEGCWAARRGVQRWGGVLRGEAGCDEVGKGD